MLAEHGQAGPNSCVCRSPIWAALVCSSPARQETGPSISLGGRGVTNPLKEALTALADALAKRPAEEILFDWFRSGRLVGELSVLIKRSLPGASGEARQKAA